MTVHVFDRLTGPALITCAAVLGAATVWQWAPTPLTPFTDGETQMALEDSLNNAVPIRDLSVSVWNGVRYALLGEMLEGGVAGTDGWLYTAEEYRQPPGHEARLIRGIAELIDSAKALEVFGTEVTIALVPDKSRMVPEHTRLPRSPWIEARYDTILTALKAAEIRVVDLRPALAAFGSDSFLMQDTHWSVVGAKAAAQAIADTIGPQGEAVFHTVETRRLSYSGDLTNFVGAGRFADRLGLGHVQIPQYTTSEYRPSGDAALSLFGDAGPVPGALVGTSYSALPHWNFVGALKEALGADLLDYSSEGKGPFIPMREYLDSLQAASAPEFAVWEVPERYLTIDP